MSLHRSSLWTGSTRRRQLLLLLGDVVLLYLMAVVAVALKRGLIDGISWSVAGIDLDEELGYVRTC